MATPPSPLPGLPDPSSVAQALRGTAYAAEVERIAESVLQHQFPLLGATLETGADIHWRRDYARGIESGLQYFKQLPYLDAGLSGDHKFIWELSRHQHLVLLAQAYLLTGRKPILDELMAQWISWDRDNPFLKGMNWTSALEVAFRALSWIWIYHLVGSQMAADLRFRFLNSLYSHGLYLEHNLSVYFSPNTHLLGEAVALHALGTLFPEFPGASHWKRLGGKTVESQMDFQVREDGSHFEQSSYYHVYAIDFFAFYQVLARTTPASYVTSLTAMVGYLHSLIDCEGRIPLMGDDDGGRFFHPYGEHDRYGRATLATCSMLLNRPEWLLSPNDLPEQAAWWLDLKRDFLQNEATPSQPPSRWFPDAGVAVMRSGPVQAIVDAGPLGYGNAGHSHADTLNLLVRHHVTDVFLDPGTYTYVGDPEWRDRFRGTSAHNTVVINGLDQAKPAGPFRWTEKPEVHYQDWLSQDNVDFLDASCRYSGFQHRRRVCFAKPDLIFILDEIAGPAGEHTIEQFWHPGSEPVRAAGGFRIGFVSQLLLSHEDLAQTSYGVIYGWRSRALGIKEPAWLIRVVQRAHLPIQFATVLDFSSEPSSQVQLEEKEGAFWVRLAGKGRVVFPASSGFDILLG
ncbi:MAG: alginate lyase family protein [Bryobacteraceae bacterium]|nr:alginate lyase family protein [Bryobacteraceae bacterium]